jgi:RNA polymerase sigma-70 factor (ECF subfamily)
LEEEWDRVRRLIAGLGPVEQQVVHLRFVEGWSLDRVAEAIGIPVGTVKSHVHRVRRRLRDLSPREGVAET